MNQLLAELRRRNVFRVAAAYLVVGWLVMQVISVISDAAGLPDWADSLALILLLAGLPVAVFIAWAFEMTPTGLKPTESVDPETSLTRATGSTLDIAILAGLGLVAVLVVSSWLWPNGGTDVEPAELVAEVTAPDAPAAPAPQPSEAEAATATDATADGPPALSVAVLPFVAMSSDVEDRYFAEGLTEEILNYLAAVPELLVTSRTSAFQFRGDDLPSVPEIAQQLGVAYIVEGSIRRSGDRVRVTAQIIRAADDSHLWSQTYDRTMDDVFAIQDDIAQNITAVLDIVLDENQLARMGEIGVQNVEAYIAYQRGVEISVEAHDRRVDTLTALEPAEALFAEATRLAPDFSDAYMRQADYYAHLMSRSVREDTEEARATLEMATDRYFNLLELAKDSTTDPNRRAMIDVDRIYLRQSWTGAGPILDRASQTTGCPFTAWLRELSALSGRSAAFLPYAQRMTQCDPLNGSNWAVLSSIAYSAGEFDIAHDAASNGLRLDSRDISLMWQSADALFQAGREDDIAEYMDFLQVPDYVRGLYAAMFAARAGDREAANEARLLMGETHALDGYALRLHAMLGEREAANAVAAQLDTLADSLNDLIAITAACRCGALWDLEATPNFARRIEEAEFPWPPPGTGDYPLKDW
jgi:adenylate cyclase